MDPTPRLLNDAISQMSKKDKEIADLRAKLQTAEQQLAGLQEKLNESEFHADNYRRSFEEMKAASIESANRANAAEQQLGQVTKELESVRQDLCETNESYEKAAHDRDVGVKDCRRLVTELGQVREEVKELRGAATSVREGLRQLSLLSNVNQATKDMLIHCGNTLNKALSATPSGGCGKGRTDKERLDWLDKGFGTSKWKWTLEHHWQDGAIFLSRNCGSGFETAREALDDAIENEAASIKGKEGGE